MTAVEGAPNVLVYIVIGLQLMWWTFIRREKDTLYNGNIMQSGAIVFHIEVQSGRVCTAAVM